MVPKRLGRLFFLVGFSFLLTLRMHAQKPGSEADSSVYRVYGEQFAAMLSVRGLEKETIDELLTIYRTNNINSDESLAALLAKLYPREQGIGILFYFFKDDTLRRVFMEPGRVIEKKYLPVKKEELFQASIDLNYLLDLYDQAENRMPLLRGLKPERTEATPGLDYPSFIKRLTGLLLPVGFDSSYKHLLVIPALNIGTIPFHLLSPYKDGSLLVDHCSITISPGIVDLVGLRLKMLKGFRDPGAPSRQAIFTLSNPLFISNPKYPDHTEYFFPDLPGAKKEIDSALVYAQHYKLLEGKAALKDTVLRYLQECDLAYFATHGVANTENPKKSFVVLSGDDPLLTVEDIMTRRSQFKSFPEMVILSACQTGLGKSMEAGVAGLARAFLLCGSNHVIMSLWNVDDTATAFLMSRFMYHLQQPSLFLPAEPLRKAMLDTREKYPAIAQWSSFSSFGIDW